jgi:DNA-binding NarL/FixJ family response regulator
VSVATIIIADDHEIVRQGLRNVLRSRTTWEIVGEAVTGRQAVEMVERLRPHVVVMDVSMPELNGLEATRQIVKIAPRTEILVLTMHDTESLVRDVLDAGARGYLLKSDASEHLVPAIEALLDRRPYLSSRVNEVLLAAYLGRTQPKGEARGGTLTAREREIVQLLAEGKSNKGVASTLGISIKTAQTHRANVMRKLDLHSVSDLVLYAVRNNIVEP